MSVETDDTNYADIETFESVEGIIRIGNSGAPSIADLSPNSDWKSFPQSTHNCCYGLPYQDHNYGAPPPPTPPPSPGSNALVTKNKSFKIALESLKPNKIVSERKLKSTHRKTTEGRRRNGANSKAAAVKPSADESKPVVVANGDQSEGKEPTASGDYSDSVTRCICDFDHDDGYMICCDQCQVWQHIDCMGIDRQDIPEEYSCEQCMPRRVYKARARLIQKKKRDDIFRSSSKDENANTRKKPSVLLKSGQKAKYHQRNDKKGLSPLKKSSSSAVAGNKKKTAINTIVNSKQRQNRRQATDSMLLSVDGDTDESPWEVPYESATTNQCSTDIEESLKAYKSAPDSQADDVLERVASPRCQLRLLVNGRRGLEVDDAVTDGQALVEFKGKVMLQQQFAQENKWLKRPQPFVLFYDKWDNLEICVDATSFGNEARFVRRCCVANAEVRHVIAKGEVHLVLFAVKDLPGGSEVTIPFDLDFRACEYEVECACSRTQCPVRKAAKKVKTLSHEDGDHLETGNGGTQAPSKQTSAAKKVVQEKLKVEIPESTVTDGNQHSSGTAQAANKINGEALKSPKEEKSGIEESRRLSREDRKIEAYMKAFEKMEKREERRKELLQKISEKKENPESAMKRVEPVKQSVRQPAEAQAPKVKMHNSKAASQTKQVVQSGTKAASQQQGKGITRQGVARRRNRSGPVLRRRSSSKTTRQSESLSEVELDENSNQPPCEGSTRIPAPSEVGSTATGTISSTDTTSFRFAKTKKHLLNEWYSENGLDKCSIDKPLTVNVSQSDSVDFVKANSSPGSSWAHLRRNSVTCSSHTTQINNTPTPASRKLDISMGSAKKRWLKQAMEEDNSNQTTPTVLMSPSSEQASTSPQGSAANVSLPASTAATTVTACQTTPSPNASSTHCTNNHTSDFVTPLKKRRLARESISLDSDPTSPEIVTEMTQQKVSVVLPALEEVAGEGHTNAPETAIGAGKHELQNAPADNLPETVCAIAPEVKSPLPAMVNAFSPESVATASHEDSGELAGSPQRRRTYSQQEVESSGSVMLSPREPRTLVDLMQQAHPSNVHEYDSDSAQLSDGQSVVSPCSSVQIPAQFAVQRLHKSLSDGGSSPLHIYNHTPMLSHPRLSSATKRSISMVEDMRHSGHWDSDEHFGGKRVHSSVNHKICGSPEYAPITPPPSKKKVSLLEYRKRMQVHPARSDSPTPIAAAPVTPPGFNNKLATGHQPSPSLTLPALPLFDDWKDCSGANGDSVLSRPPLSLDERLKLEFGLTTASPEKTAAVKGNRASLSPPPPPPPVPHPIAQDSPASLRSSKPETSEFSNDTGEKMPRCRSRTSEMNGHSDWSAGEEKAVEALSTRHQDVDCLSHRHDAPASPPDHLKKPNRALKQGSLGAVMLGHSVASAIPSRDISGTRQLTQFDLPKKYR